MNLLLVDTGPLVALANKRDKYHQKCSTFLERYRGRLLTTWSVLTEFSHLAHSVSATLALYQWIERGGMEISPLGRDELVSTIDWITRYADHPMDLADASLIVTAIRTGCIDVWTLNRADFETYRLPGRKRIRLA